MSGAALPAAVRRARLRRGLTQQALAAACGLSRQTVAQVEAGTFSDLGVRKLERMLAALDLALVVTERPGERAGSRLERLLAGRAAQRRRKALALAARTLGALRAAGVSASIVGSLAKGRYRAGSDADFLVEDRGPLSESRIVTIAERTMAGFPFAIIFAGRADAALLEMMRKEARGGPSAVRAA
jgi:transcriptional regulator with XRE-family HTH domain